MMVCGNLNALGILASAIAVCLITDEGWHSKAKQTHSVAPATSRTDESRESRSDQGSSETPESLTKSELESQLKTLRQQRIENLKAWIETANERLVASEAYGGASLIQIVSCYESLVEAQVAADDDVRTKIKHLQESLAAIRRFRNTAELREEGSDVIFAARSAEKHAEIILTLLQLSAVPSDKDDSAATNGSGQGSKLAASAKEMDSETLALCEERRKLLREAIQQNAAARGPGRQEAGADFSLYRSWVDSELELAETQQEKERLVQAYVDQVQFVVNSLEARVRMQVASPEGLGRARIALVEAKLFQRRFLSGSN